MTPAEKLLWQYLRANRFGGWHFRRQQIIKGFIVDFFCHKAGLVIEIDGPIHEFQIDADKEREVILKDLGLTIIRFNNNQVLNETDIVLQVIQKKLTQLEIEKIPPPSGGGQRRGSQ